MTETLILSGKDVRESCMGAVKGAAMKIKREYGYAPTLAVVTVGDNKASQLYVRNKKSDCEKCGIAFEEHKFSEGISEETLIEAVKGIGNMKHIHGIIVQLPIPVYMNTRNVLSSIPKEKDVDCMNPYNIGRMYSGENTMLPCTPYGILKLMKFYGINVAGKDCVVIGRSDIVGKPMSTLLMKMDATVTVCHSKSSDILKYTKNADIIIAALGHKWFITEDMIKPGAIIIDVGINYTDDGKLCGDVSPEVIGVASAVTPVPGGVGPMTRLALLLNTIKAADNRHLIGELI